jgi:hypothetical protein
MLYRGNTHGQVGPYPIDEISRGSCKKNDRHVAEDLNQCCCHISDLSRCISTASPYEGSSLQPPHFGTGKTRASASRGAVLLDANKRVVVLAPAFEEFRAEVIKMRRCRCDRQAVGNGRQRAHRSWRLGRQFKDLSDEQKANSWLRKLVKQKYSIVGCNGLASRGLEADEGEFTLRPTRSHHRRRGPQPETRTWPTL